MVQQTVLPFKPDRAEERITARGGLALYAEFLHALGVEALLDRRLPQPRSGRGLKANQYVTPLSLTLYGGGETLEDVREIRDDQTLRTALDLPTLPSISGHGGLAQADGPEGRHPGDGAGQ